MLRSKSEWGTGFLGVAALLALLTVASLGLLVWPPGAAEAQDSQTYGISSAVTAGEGEGASLTVTLGQNAPTGGLEFSVTPTYSSGTGKAAAADVASLPATVTIPAGDNSATLNIGLAHDQAVESDETFTVAIATQAAGWSAASAGANTATVTIQDRTVVVTFGQTSYDVTEGANPGLVVTLNLSRPAGREALINVNMISGAKVFMYDVQIGVTDSGTVEKDVFSFDDDDIVHVPWRYTLALEIPESAAKAGFVAGTDATATMIRHDNDPLADLQATSDDGQLSLAWSVPWGTATGYEIQYSTRDAPDAPASTPGDPSTGWVNSVHSGVATSHTITGLTNDWRYNLRVRVVNDHGKGIWSVTGAVPVTSQPSRKPILEFSARRDCWINEGSHADFPIELSTDYSLYPKDTRYDGVESTLYWPVDISVGIRVVKDEHLPAATETEDYTLSTTKLTIPAFSTAWDWPSVRVYANADQKTEGPEAITLELVQVEGAPYTLKGRSRIRACIWDSSISPGLILSDDTGGDPVSEGSTVTVTVQLPQPAPKGGTLVIPHVRGAGTATEHVEESDDGGDAGDYEPDGDGSDDETEKPPGDFSISALSLNIPEGEQSGTFTVTIIDDDEIEHDETIELGAGSINPRLTAQTSILTITIKDNDPVDLPPLHLNQAPTVSAAIPDSTIVNESGTRAISLSGVFSDVDGLALTVTAVSSDESVARVSVYDDYSALWISARSRGTAAITVTANDGRGGTVSDEFTVKVKAAPVVASAIADVTNLNVGNRRMIPLPGVFSDADGDALTFDIQSSNFGAVYTGFLIDYSNVVVRGNGEGKATVTLTAQDADGNRVNDTFEVTVIPAQLQHGNNVPTVSNAIADATIVSEDGTHQASLSGVFDDADGDDLTITAISSNEDVATVSVSAGYSALTVTAEARGTAIIIVTADDGEGGSVEDFFVVKVKSAPVVAAAIADVSELAVDATHEVSLSGVFSDADGDSLTVTASSSDEKVATVSVAADNSSLTVTAKSEGVATIKVTAQDSDGNRVSDTFGVSVPAAREQPESQADDDPAVEEQPQVQETTPQEQQDAQQRVILLPGAVANLTLTAKGGSVQVSWSAPESGGAPERYIVHLRPENGEKGSGKTKTPKAKKTSVTFEKLEPGQTYKVWARAQNEAGKGERVYATITLPDTEGDVQ